MDGLVDWAGSLASMLGLILSGFVLYVSAGAKKAAEQARAAVERKTLAGELHTVKESVNQVSLLAGHQKWELAHHVANQTLGTVIFVKARWEEHLPKTTGPDLKLLEGHLHELLSRLEVCQHQPPNAEKLQRLRKVLQTVAEHAITASGKAEARSARGFRLFG